MRARKPFNRPSFTRSPTRAEKAEVSTTSRAGRRCIAADTVRNCSRVELEPVTGRTHQLRVHMQALGHPMLGDTLYATPEALALSDRLQLHARTLLIPHPVSGVQMEFHAPVPF